MRRSVLCCIRLVSLVALVATLAEARPASAQTGAGTLELAAANAAADGAAVRIDGQPAGNVPQQAELAAGRHLVQVGRRGYVTHSQWVVIEAGQTLHLSVGLRSRDPSGTRRTTGTVLVAGDVSGAEVQLDGVVRGRTPVELVDVPVGRHAIRVTASDPALPVFEQEITVTAGQRTTVHPVMRPLVRPGSLRVLTEPSGAELWLDGERVGQSPMTIQRLAPGEHILEARLEGRRPARETVVVRTGRRRVVRLALEEPNEGPGTIIVRSNVSAEVTVNGHPFGGTPVILEGAQPGRYAIVVRASGYREVRHLCTVELGGTCELDATLEPESVLLGVTANVPGAHLHIDGEARGELPWEGMLRAGEHRVEVRAEGYVSHIQQINLRATDGRRDLEVTLRAEGATPDEQSQEAEERRQLYRQTTSHSATRTPMEQATADLSLGFPYLIEARVGGPIHRWVDVGLGVRTFFGLTEFEGLAQMSYPLIGGISVGAQFRFYGGVGPERQLLAGTGKVRTNTFGASIEGLLTLLLTQLGSFSVVLGLDLNSDRYRENRRRGTARVRLGGTVEAILSDHWNVFAQFEGVLSGSRRAILTDLFGAGVYTRDRRLYGSVGVTYKFGRPIVGHRERDRQEPG